MSDNVPVRKQQGCLYNQEKHDNKFQLDIFSSAQGLDGSYKRIYLYFHKLFDNSTSTLPSIYLREEQHRLCLCKVSSQVFCWKEERSKKIVAKLDLGDFAASKEVKRQKIMEMNFPEKVVFTLPTCNATHMEIITSLLNENQELIFTTGPQTIEISKIKLPVEETRPAMEHSYTPDHLTA